jgi:hypothetical protein
MVRLLLEAMRGRKALQDSFQLGWLADQFVECSIATHGWVRDCTIQARFPQGKWMREFHLVFFEQPQEFLVLNRAPQKLASPAILEKSITDYAMFAWLLTFGVKQWLLQFYSSSKGKKMPAMYRCMRGAAQTEILNSCTFNSQMQKTGAMCMVHG